MIIKAKDQLLHDVRPMTPAPVVSGSAMDGAVCDPALFDATVASTVLTMLHRPEKPEGAGEGDCCPRTASVKFMITRQEEQELRKQVIALVNTLPARQQEIIFLRFYEGMSYEEIAVIMDINMSSTYKLLYKALDNLQKVSDKRFLTILFCLFLLMKKNNLVLEG